MGSLRSRMPAAAKTALPKAGGQWRNPRLTNPASLVVTLDDVNLHLRRFRNGQQRIIIEIGGFHATVLEYHLFLQGNAEPPCS